jgi:crotonobetainyl-CoA:carnitine CoA-transferase CaiB-like acyl-CoA transferase
LIELMGNPPWALDPALRDPLERGRRGAEINRHLRAWAKTQRVDDVVQRGQALSVPLAKYNTPADILRSEQIKARHVFEPLAVSSLGTVPAFTAPIQLDGRALTLGHGAAAPGADNAEIWCGLLGHTTAELDDWSRHGTV